MALTPRQRALVRELDELTDLLDLDYRDCAAWEPEARIPKLELAKSTLVRGQVILWYTLFDEFLSSLIAQYLFGRATDFRKLWKTKKFQRFNHFVLERLTFLQKLQFAKAIVSLPKSLTKTAESLNSVRNALAHSFFTEQLRVPPAYRGHSIFSLNGIKALDTDFGEVYRYFMKRLGLN
jgi:hypothetical protein